MRPAKVIPDISFRYHRDWGYWFRPNLNIRFPFNPVTRTPAYYLHTNSVGAPCSHEIDEPRSGRKAVLFIGCSFTVGHGVPVEESFTRRLELSRPDLMCHTYALNGSGNCQQLLFHNHFAPQIDPDILVLSPYTGCVGRTVLRERDLFDALRDRRVDRPKPYFLLDENGELLLGNSPVPTMVDHFHGVPRPHPVPFRFGPGPALVANASSGLEQQMERPPVVSEPHTPSYEIYSQPDSDHYRTVKRVVQTTIESSSAKRRILMPLPHLMNVLHPEEDYRCFYREVADATGCEFVDVLPDFAEWREAGLDRLYIESDGHFSPQGNLIVARKLAAVI